MYDEQSFRAKVERALELGRRVLENERRPVLASEVQHRWIDKFGMAEVLTNVAGASVITVLEALGLNERSLRQAREWAEKRSVTVRLRAEERCTLEKEEKKEVEDPTKYVRDYGVGKVEDKVVRTVTEYTWRFSVDYRLVMFPGNGEDEEGVVLQKRTATCNVVTTTKEAPRKEVVVRDAVDVNITWVLQQLDKEGRMDFRIKRESSECHTPRRNTETARAEEFFGKLESWGEKVTSYLKDQVFPIQRSEGQDVGAMNTNSLFVPVIPLFEELGEQQREQERRAAEAAAGAKTTLVGARRTKEEGEGEQGGGGGGGRVVGGPVLSASVVQRFLDEAKRSLSEKMSEMAKAFPEGAAGKLITAAEANIVVATEYGRDVSTYYLGGMEFIEDMIRKALVAAIGKEVTPGEFGKYMEFHNRKIFKSEYQPRAFCYAVRRPNHYPEGIVTIEMERGGGAAMAEAVQTVSARAEIGGRMEFAVGAGAKVGFKGEVYVHGAVLHEFEGEGGGRVWLSARARQFSSFVVLVGKLAGPGLFDPQYGVVVQNKDEVTIPLELETIPSAGEFKAAVVSISPEMQEFAKMYRGMQLSSTLFAVCVLQIKPQMERVLNLRHESLTKEIKLTQDLLKLFIEYQTPSDMLSFAGAAEASKEMRLGAVKSNVRMMQWTIDNEKFKQTEDDFKKAEADLVQKIASLGTDQLLYSSLKSASASLAYSPREEEMLLREGRGRRGKSSQAKKKVAEAFETPAPAPEAPAGGEAFDEPISMSAPPPPPVAESAMDMDDMEFSRADKKEAAPMKKKMMSRSRKKEYAPKLEMEEEKKKERYDPYAEERMRLRRELEELRRRHEERRAELQKRKLELDTERAQLDLGNVVHEATSFKQVQPYSGRDYTAIPTDLEGRLDKLDTEGALRPTIINVGKQWTKKSQKSLLAEATTKNVGPDEQKIEKNTCYDLLDALTRSGGLEIEGATLHVVIASTHIFDKSVLNTLVEDNVNPIDRMEKSGVIVASAIHGKTPQELLKPNEAARIQKAHPEIF